MVVFTPILSLRYASRHTISREKKAEKRKLKTGHFYFAKNRTFLNWLDTPEKGD
jgi:hypothetical protein